MVHRAKTIMSGTGWYSFPQYYVSVIGSDETHIYEVMVYPYTTVEIEKKFLGFIKYKSYIRKWGCTDEIFQGRYPDMETAYLHYQIICLELENGNEACVFSRYNMSVTRF